MEKTIHQGRNIRHFREMLGLKQEGLALALGDDWNQRKISVLEQREVIEEDILSDVAKALKVPVDVIKKFDVEDTIFNIQNNYDGSNPNSYNIAAQVSTTNNDCTINYADKWFEAMDEIKKLYERLLQAEKEKVELMQQMLNKLK